MERFSEKVFLSLKMPKEEVPLSDQKRIRLALETLGYQNVSIPLPVLRQLYPMCRSCGYDITVTLVCQEPGWVSGFSRIFPGRNMTYFPTLR